MAQVMDMKRLGALALALLLVMAVAGPVCLMFASSAMAMPMDVQTAPCDEDRGSTACPYERPDGTLGVKAPTVDSVAALAMVTAGDAPDIVEQFVGLGVGDLSGDPPPSHLTPLRI